MYNLQNWRNIHDVNHGSMVMIWAERREYLRTICCNLMDEIDEQLEAIKLFDTGDRIFSDKL